MYFRISEKYDQTSINVTNNFDFTSCHLKSNDYVPLLDILHKNL